MQDTWSFGDGMVGGALNARQGDLEVNTDVDFRDSS